MARPRKDASFDDKAAVARIMAECAGSRVTRSSVKTLLGCDDQQWAYVRKTLSSQPGVQADGTKATAGFLIP